MSESDRPIAFWDALDRERLTHETIGEAIDDYLESSLRVVTIGDTITVTAHGRARVDMPHVLEWALECLNEEHGDPEEWVNTPTDAMKVAEKAFLEVLAAEYVPWQCEAIGTVTVRITAIDPSVTYEEVERTGTIPEGSVW